MNGFLTVNDVISAIDFNAGFISLPYEYKLPKKTSKSTVYFSNEYGIKTKHEIFNFEADIEDIININILNNPKITFINANAFVENFFGIKLISNTYEIFSNFKLYNEIIECVRYLKQTFPKSKEFTLFVLKTDIGIYANYLAINDVIIANFMLYELRMGLLNFYIYPSFHKSRKYLPIRRKWFYKFLFLVDVESKKIKIGNSYYDVRFEDYKKEIVNKVAYITCITRNDIDIKGLKLPEIGNVKFYDINHNSLFRIVENSIESEEQYAELALFLFRNGSFRKNSKNIISNVDFIYEIDTTLL